MVSQSKAASKEEILRVNWNEQSIAELEKLIPDQKAAQQFATEVLMAEPHTDPENIHTLDVDMEALVEYEFVDLKGDGSVQFVCLLDVTLRMLPTLLMAAENDHGQLKTAYLTGGEGGYGMGHLGGIIRDIKHDGRNEVLTEEALGPFGSSFNRTVSSLTTTRTRRCPSDARNSTSYCSTALHRVLVPEEREDHRNRIDAKQKEIAELRKLLSNT